MGARNREEDKLERREEQAKRERTSGEFGEKQKKSWREVDAQRDGARSQSSQGERGPRPQKGESPAYRAYKSKLDKLFDGERRLSKGPEVEIVGRGHEPKPAPRNAPPSSSAAPIAESLSPKEQLRQASSPVAIAAAARACLGGSGLPNDSELLEKVLGLDDAALQGKALEALLDACERGRPRNAKSLAARLGAIEPTLADPVWRDIARGLLLRFG